MPGFQKFKNQAICMGVIIGASEAFWFVGQKDHLLGFFVLNSFVTDFDHICLRVNPHAKRSNLAVYRDFTVLNLLLTCPAGA